MTKTVQKGDPMESSASLPEMRMHTPAGESRPIRVLYSFPHKLGADRICYTAWQQVNGLAAAGAEVLAFPGVLHRPVPANVVVRPTLAWGRLRVSYRLLGTLRALALHDYLVSRRLERLRNEIDIVHCWPDAALQTLRTAARLGIPTVLERPNAHTRYAYEAVNAECRRLGITLPPGHEYYYNTEILDREEAEYREAFRILCPSDFVVKTFRDQGVSGDKLLRHLYGVDTDAFHAEPSPNDERHGLRVLFVGVCAVRKGVHFALEAWLRSPAHRDGQFLIAGEFLPEYADKIRDLLSDPSVHVLGHRSDIPELMRNSDILVLPSIEEGFGLVCTEAMASGCVPLVSDACTDICQHMKNSLVHAIGDVESISRHITMLHEDRPLLARLREAALDDAKIVTWEAAGRRLIQAYQEAITAKKQDLLADQARVALRA
jgi:glycosyltransferase involved in cell wall biosynthesis